MTNKKYKYVFIDFDDTIVRTLTGNTFPKGVWDMQIQFRLLDAISKVKPEYIFIVSNQGGIPIYVTEEQIQIKMTYVCSAIESYLGNDIKCNYTYCASMDKNDNNRKPNTGMLDIMCAAFKISQCADNKKNMCMIGDASGKKNQFSNSDFKCAKNFGIDYYDVEDFIRMCQESYDQHFINIYTERAQRYANKIIEDTKNKELTEEETILVNIEYECYNNAFINGWMDVVEFVDRYDETINDILMRIYEENEIISTKYTETIENYIKEGYNKGKKEASEYYEIPIDND